MSATEQSAPTLRARLEDVQRRIAQSARGAGRAPEEVTLIAVTKTHPAEVVRQALAAGARDFGENRAQEAEGKIKELGRASARWHLIGHLQSNKARRAVKLFDVIHSLDSLALAERLDRMCAEEGRATLDVLLQVDLAGEATKSGVGENELSELAARVGACAHLRLRGLMTLPPFFAEAERVRPFFRRLRELRDELRAREAFGAAAGELSMGMSHDYEVAIAEGATMVRIGTAIFGARAARA